MKYNVLVHVEQEPEDQEDYREATEPVGLRSFATLDDATAYVRALQLTLQAVDQGAIVRLVDDDPPGRTVKDLSFRDGTSVLLSHPDSHVPALWVDHGPDGFTVNDIHTAQPVTMDEDIDQIVSEWKEAVGWLE